jgi:hypothetical protein
MRAADFMKEVTMAGEEKPKLTEEEFIRKAVKKLRGKYKGIHSVFSGFNTAFKQYFGTNPVEATQRLASEGKINIRPVKGGVMIYLPEDAPNMAENVLKKILEDDE